MRHDVKISPWIQTTFKQSNYACLRCSLSLSFWFFWANFNHFQAKIPFVFILLCSALYSTLHAHAKCSRTLVCFFLKVLFSLPQPFRSFLPFLLLSSGGAIVSQPCQLTPLFAEPRSPVASAEVAAPSPSTPPSSSSSSWMCKAGMAEGGRAIVEDKPRHTVFQEFLPASH